jgi:anti-sigma factor RsiW
MRDSRFIELVNLYIDRQITAEETAELEAEMQDNPRRRAVYRQYCQLHSATKQVYDRFRANAADPQAAAPAGQARIAAFEGRPRSNWIHYVGGLVAAACLAMVFVRYNSSSPPPADLQAGAEPKPAAQVATVSVVAAPAPSLISLRSPTAVQPDYTALLATLRQDESRSFSSTENQSNPLPSLFDDGVFEVRPARPANGQRIFRGKQTPAPAAEFTAFQFQR